MSFQKNCESLLSTGRSTAEALVKALQTASLPNTNDMVLLPNESGDCGFEYQGTWLHDPQNPLEEVRQGIQKSCEAKQDHVHLIFGLGLGYALDELYQQSPSLAIIVYEPDLSLLRFTLENVDLSHVLKSERVHLIADYAEFLDLVKHLLYGYFQIDSLILPGMAKRFSKEIPVWSRDIRSMVQDWQRNYGSLKRFLPQWTERFFENLSGIVSTPALDDLQNIYVNRAALIISRGPSLDTALEVIAQLKGKVFLISVGAALHRLYSANISPDFAVFYDMNGLDEQIHGLPESYLSQITVITGLFSRNLGKDYPFRQHRWLPCQATQNFGQWLDEALGNLHQRIEGGGSVSIAALQLGVLMGCSELVLMGQDLAFPKNQVYAGGTVVQKDEEGRLNLAASETLFMQEALAMTSIQGQNGETLQTLEAYTTYARQLESYAVQLAEEKPSVRLYNASIGGAQLNGYELRPLSDCKSLWQQAADSVMSPPHIIFSEDEQQERQKKLLKAIDKTIQRLQGAHDLFEKQSKALRRVLSLKTSASRQLLSIEETVWDCVAHLLQFLNQDDFLAYLLHFEMAPFKQRFRAYKTEPLFKMEMSEDLMTTLETLKQEVQTYQRQVLYGQKQLLGVKLVQGVN
jgi:hypothetical protein